MTTEKKQVEDEDWALDDYVSDYLKGNDLPFEQSAGFLRTYRNYVWDYANQAARLGDGSEEAYQKYLAAQTAQMQQAADNAVKNILGESGNGSPVMLQQYLNEGVITLKKIADHPKHYVDGMIFVDDATYFYEDAYGNGSEYEIYDRYNDEWTEETTMMEPTQPLYAESDYDIQSSFPIPQSVTKQLQDGQVAVELCHTELTYFKNDRVGSQSKTYDGYYAVTVDKTRFSRNVPQDYAAYQAQYQEMKEGLSRIQNILFVYVDNDTIFSDVHGEGTFGDPTKIRNHVATLRKKLGRARDMIVNNPNLGYRLLP